MNMNLLALLTPFVGLTIYVLLHFLISRYLAPVRKWATMRNLYVFLVLIIWFGSGIAFDFFDQSADAFRISIEWLDLLTVVFVIFLIHIGYLTFYALIDRSISIRTFVEIEKRGNQPIIYRELEAIYNPKAAYLRRFEILKESGLIKNKDEQLYVLTPKGRRVATIIRAFKLLYKMSPGG